MRPFLALMITVLLFAGVYGYTSFVDSIRRPPLEIVENFSNDEFALRVSRTMDCTGDLDFDVPAIVVKFRGQEIFLAAESLLATQPLEIRPLKNVVESANEVYVSASLKNDVDGGWGDDWGAGSSNSAGDAWGDDWDDEPKSELDDNEASEKSEAAVKSKTAVLGAIRVQIIKGNDTIVDRTIWQAAGANVIQGSVSFSAKVETQQEHEHE